MLSLRRQDTNHMLAPFLEWAETSVNTGSDSFNVRSHRAYLPTSCLIIRAIVYRRTPHIQRGRSNMSIRAIDGPYTPDTRPGQVGIGNFIFSAQRRVTQITDKASHPDCIATVTLEGVDAEKRFVLHYFPPSEKNKCTLLSMLRRSSITCGQPCRRTMR